MTQTAAHPRVAASPGTIVSDPTKCERARVEILAAAIANTRGARLGMPQVVNVLQMLPADLREKVIEEAQAGLAALRAAGCAV